MRREGKNMLLQDKNKKGVSLMISYILLVVFAVVIGAIVFAWLRTYVPSQGLSCPDGTSVFIKESSFNDSTLKLNLILRNSGRFDIAGYFIQATNNSEQEVATIDLSAYLNESFGGKKFGNSVVFQSGKNAMGPGDTRTNIFDIPSGLGEPYSVNIIPTRYQVEDNRQRFVSCSNAKVQQLVGEPFVCVPKTCADLNYSCTPSGANDGCGGALNCGSCQNGFFCDAAGQCISTSCTPTANPCGTRVCGTATNGTCGAVNCGPNNGLCDPGFECNQGTGQCITLCGNGIINTDEACDDGNTNNGDGCSNVCQIEGGWTCSGQPSTCLQGGAGGSFNSCGDYCDTFQGYSAAFSCVQNPQQCAGLGKVWIGDIPGSNATYGDSLCTGGNADTCCCTPG